MRRGFSFLEVLVAVAIASVFLGSLYTSFIQVLRTVQASRARLEALRNSRSAIMTLHDEFKAISRSGANFLLIVLDETLDFGDGIDADQDNAIDEEIPDGRDDDGDWDPATDDLHAQIGTGAGVFFDRFTFTQKDRFGALFGPEADDLGDFHVDEDLRFGRDRIVFRLFPSAPGAAFASRTIVYMIGSFEGQRNVLIRQVHTEFTNRPSLVTTAPLAFNVLGFDLMCWDPNGNPDPSPTGSRAGRPYWALTWNSEDVANFNPPRLPLPASLFTRVTCYADSAPFANYADGDRVQTLTMQDMVNIEETIGDALYPRPSL